ncbi:hypothetical protein BV25DRAFT_198598 [Artomyces pyxidatus]|uniref:Uncharacterized protein n=1 Tax=Artomyces pyxidatus TaxID=48021 RepID=A0ACB8T9N4_9AGAM|nr:hypothetical protein BV25DRAFT_198598 [Artomyces pyxidatus]
MYGALVLTLITFFGEETYAGIFPPPSGPELRPNRCDRMYDRTHKPIPQRPTSGLRYRVETLLGFTGIKMAQYRPSWTTSCLAPFSLVWRPHLLGVLFFEAFLFGFGIGINVRQ